MTADFIANTSVSAPPGAAAASTPELTADHDAQRRTFLWDVQSGPRNYLFLITGQVLGSIFALVTAWLATRLLRADGYGVVVAITSAAQAVSQLLLQWTAVALFRHGCEEFVRTGSIARTFWARSLLLALNLLLVLGTAFWWLPYLSQWLRLPPGAQPFVVTFLLVMVLSVHMQYALQAAKLPASQGMLVAVERAAILLAIAVLGVTGRASVLAVITSYWVGPILVSLISAWRLRRFIFPVVYPDGRILRQMLAFSLPLVPMGFFGFFSTNYLDAFFISHYLDSSHLGVYGVAYLAAGATMQLPTLTGTLLLPFFVTLQASDRSDGISRYFERVLPLVVLSWSAATIALALLGNIALPWLFGPQFRDTGRLLWPLMAAFAFAGPILMGFAPISNAISRTRVAAVSATVAAFMNLVLDAVLIPRYGLMGCAWASTIAYAVTLLVWMMLMRDRVPPRTWYVMMTLPTSLGAAMVSWRGGAVIPFGVATAAIAVAAVLYRVPLREGLRTLDSLQLGKSLATSFGGRA